MPAHRSPSRPRSDEPPSATSARWPARLHAAGLQRNSPIVSLVVLGTCDLLIWMLAWPVAAVATAPTPGLRIIPLVAITLIAQLAVGGLLGVYRHRDPVGSIPELRGITLAALVILVVLAGSTVMLGGRAVEGTTLLAWLLALVLIVTARQLLRVVFDLERRPRSGARVVIVGAGALGASLVEQMLQDPTSPYLPVALVDDDRAKRHFRVHGIPVRGTTDDLAATIAHTGATGAVVAISHASSELFARLSDQLAQRDAWLRTVPSLSEMIGQPVGVSSIREIDVSDLIGRAVSRPDPARVRAQLRGRRVLVTGAGGSIGSELSRQIHALDPASLVMLDRDESALHALSMTLYGRALLDSSEFVLADIRDREALAAVFDEHRPEVVFHAAALKHLPMLERYPAEAWKTNVHGTLNVVDVARAHAVEHFVNISTDKAARPTSVLGLSKRVAEGITTAAADRTGHSYVNVRFGNVIGSRGSAIPVFEEQIRNGGPVTITHPDVTRYFMTIPEACELVLYAMTVGDPGETLVLDMGSPVRILDIVQRMMTLFNRCCPIVYTGLRPGEKLSEELFTPDEQDVVRTSERISHVHNAGIEPSALPRPSSPQGEIDAFYVRAIGHEVGRAPRGVLDEPFPTVAGSSSPARTVPAEEPRR